MFIVIRASEGFDTSLLSGWNLVCDNHTPNLMKTVVYQQVVCKPVSDSFEACEKQSFYLFEGVLVNSTDLVNAYASPNIKHLLRSALEAEPAQMLSRFHGQFCGLYIDQTSGMIRVFTNQTDTLRVYYYSAGDVFVASTSLRQLNLLLRANNIQTNVDETGARMILTYGFLLSDFTTIKEIKHLKAGNYLEYLSNKLQVKTYHSFNNEPKYSNMPDICDNLQHLFCRSVMMSFDKDRDFGKRHLAFLSGGLDSRQVVMTAHQMGYRDITCLNFSEPGAADKTIACKIARKLGLELLYFSLQGGEYLLDLDINLPYNDAQVLLHGAAHLYAGITSLDTSSFGLLHSGQIGDGVLGSLLYSSAQQAVDLYSGAYSRMLLEPLLPSINHLRDQYPNNEIYLLYNRGFNAAVNGDYACAQRSFSVSPFLEPEFAQYCLNVAPELRFGNKVYTQWMLRYNPAGAAFHWEKTGCAVGAASWKRQFVRVIRGIDRKARQRILAKRDVTGMNPFDKWWLQNEKLRQKYADVASIGLEVKDKLGEELWADVAQLAQSNITSEKLLAYTLVAGTKYLYGYAP